MHRCYKTILSKSSVCFKGCTEYEARDGECSRRGNKGKHWRILATTKSRSLSMQTVHSLGRVL